MPRLVKSWPGTAFGRLVERRRLELGLSQVELSKALGYSDSYISQIERGRMPSMKAPDFLERWARVLQVSTETLIAEGKLEQYNLVPAKVGELTAARRLLLAVTAHMTDEEVERLARGVRAQFGEPPPEPVLALGPTDNGQPTGPSAGPHQGGTIEPPDPP